MDFIGCLGSVAVVIPTFNECENIASIVSKVRDAVPSADLVIVDDNSPDGTGRIADDLSDADPQIYVLHRGGKSGLASAYIAGFGWALARGYDVLVEMDADGSHDPAQLVDLIAALDAADLVIGSRWMAGGQVRNWPKSREILSRAGNAYARMMLGVTTRDATGGFRAFRASALCAINLKTVESQGYCFQIDLVLRAVRAGLRVVEVPITFTERSRGSSKMDRAIVAEALWRVTRWRLAEKALRRPARRVVAEASG